MKPRRIRRGLTTAQTTWVVIGCVAGALVLMCIGTALAVGILLPALGKAREHAMETASTMQLRQIEQAISVARLDSSVTVNSAQELIDSGYITPQLLNSRFGPVGDGYGDYWIAFDRPEPSEVNAPARYIVSYDRAMYAGEPTVAACVLNGTCEPLDFQKFQSLLNDPVNADRQFNLPKRQQTK